MEKNIVPQLVHYLPSGSVQQVAEWIEQTSCEFRVAKPRRTKFGDYRAPFGRKGHRISVNSDLNPYSFLLTTVHEFAHLRTWEVFGNRVKPHGGEWKKIFRELMRPFFVAGIFPEQLKNRLEVYLQKPAASSCVDLALYRALRDYDSTTKAPILEEVQIGTTFAVHGGRSFVKGERLKKRYMCVEIQTGKKYLFHPLCEIELLNAGS